MLDEFQHNEHAKQFVWLQACPSSCEWCGHRTGLMLFVSACCLF